MEGTEVRKLTELEDRHWWYRERRAIVARALRGLRPGTALDVGAAGGGNTRVLQAHGLAGGGPGVRRGRRPRVRRARDPGGARGRHPAAARARRASTSCVAYDVLEHLVDDAAAAKGVFQLLRPGGTFLVAVPCDMRLWSAHDEAVDHVRRYERDELLGLLTGAGFEIAEVRSWMVLLRPAVRLRRRSSSGSDLDDPPPLAQRRARRRGRRRALPAGRPAARGSACS